MLSYCEMHDNILKKKIAKIISLYLYFPKIYVFLMQEDSLIFVYSYDWIIGCIEAYYFIYRKTFLESNGVIN